MFVRKTLAGVIATAVAGSTLALTAGTASAAPYAPERRRQQDHRHHRDRPHRRRLGHHPARAQAARRRLEPGCPRRLRPDLRRRDLRRHRRRRPAGAADGRQHRARRWSVRTAPAPAAPPCTAPATCRTSTSPAPRRASAAETTAGMQVLPVRARHRRDGGRRQQPGRRADPTLTLAQLHGHLRDLHDHQLEPGQPGLPNQPIEPFVPQTGSGTESFFKGKVLPAGTTSTACVRTTRTTRPDRDRGAGARPDACSRPTPNAIVPFSQGPRRARRHRQGDRRRPRSRSSATSTTWSARRSPTAPTSRRSSVRAASSARPRPTT